MRRSITCTVAVACLLLSIPRPAVSQQAAVSFDQLPTALKIGDAVVVSVNGSEVEGEVEGLSPTSLVLLVPTGRLTTPSRRNFSENEVTQIRRRGDSLVNGTLYGAGAGALGGFLVSGAYLCDGCSWSSAATPAAFAAVGAGIGAGTGLALDALFRNDHVIYIRPASMTKVQLVPVCSGQRRGAMLSFRF